MTSEILLFLNIGTSEMMLILVVALFFFGGKKLPELARGLGRGIREFKDASETIKKDISDQINNFEKDLEVKDEAPKALAQHTTDNSASTYGDINQDATSGDVSHSDQYYQQHDYDYNYPEDMAGTGSNYVAESQVDEPVTSTNEGSSEKTDQPAKPDQPENV